MPLAQPTFSLQLKYCNLGADSEISLAPPSKLILALLPVFKAFCAHLNCAPNCLGVWWFKCLSSHWAGSSLGSCATLCKAQCRGSIDFCFWIITFHRILVKIFCTILILWKIVKIVSFHDTAKWLRIYTTLISAFFFYFKQFQLFGQGFFCFPVKVIRTYYKETSEAFFTIHYLPTYQ